MNCQIVDDSEWDQIVLASENATFFHQRAWMELWQDIFPNHKSVCYKFSDSNKPPVYIAGITKKLFKNLLPRFDAGPQGTYGHFLSNENISERCVRNIFKELKNCHSFSIYLLNENNNLDYSCIVKENQTQIIEFDKQINPTTNYHSNTIRNIKKAENNNFIIKQAFSEYDWDLYYKLYYENSNRWGKPVNELYPQRLFRALYHNKNLNKKLYLVWHENKLVYGGLILIFNTKAYYWHGCGEEESMKKGAAYALHDFIIHDLWNKGFASYDLMPNGGINSIFQFKSGFGAVSIPVQEIYFRNKRYQFAEFMSTVINKFTL